MEIQSVSRKAARMERRHRRARSMTGLNMVSLMDIFTILVFFLLVNSTEVEVLPSTTAIELPQSHAMEKPRQNLVILVNDRDILVQGKAIAPVDEALAAGEEVIPALREELEYQAKRAGDADGPRAVTIMGDKGIPYRLLKKVMLTCTRADYTAISLAVLQKVAQAGGEGS